MMIGIFIIIYIILLLINRRVFSTILNYANITISIWVFASVLSIINPYDMYIPSSKVYFYVLLFLILFEMFTLNFSRFKKNKTDKKDENIICEKNCVNWELINVCMTICILVLIPFMIKGISIIYNEGFSKLRDAYLQYRICSNKMYMFLTMVIIPMGEIGGFYSVLSAIENRKISYSLIMTVILMLQLVLLTGGRSQIVVFILLIAILLIEKIRETGFKKILHENKKALIILIVSLFAVAGITLYRNLQGKGLLYNFYVYFSGEMHLFGVYLNNPEKYLLAGDDLLYGQVLISFIFYPITFILRLFGSKITAGYYIINNITSKFVNISNTTSINNSSTFLYYAVRDFGVFGIVIYTFLISLLLSCVYNKKENQKNSYSKILYYYIFIQSLFLLLEFPFGHTSFLFAIIYIKLYSFDISKNKKINNIKVLKYLFNPSFVLLWLDEKNVIRLKDETFLKIKYKKVFNRELNLNNPLTFNEKLQWLKLHNRKGIYTKMVDKYEAKEYVSRIIGNEYIIPTIGIYDKLDDIDFSILPNQFVMKCTHDSGGLVIVDNKNKFNVKSMSEKFKSLLKSNFYIKGREWPYKNVKPRIIIEKYMGKNLMDYKFMCFNGKVECLFVCTERNSGSELKVTFFDKDWNVMPFERHYSKSSKKINKPINFDKMIELAEKLSKNIPFVRVDFYEIDNKIYFGELTFFPGCGFEEFTPEEWDYKLGEKININSKFGD